MTVRGFPARGDGPFNRASKTAWLAVLTCLLTPAQLVIAQPAQSLSEGVQAYYRGDYLAAANLARQLAKVQPGTSGPYVLLARAEASQGNLQQASKRSGKLYESIQTTRKRSIFSHTSVPGFPKRSTSDCLR
jgi:hypothetical protein